MRLRVKALRYGLGSQVLALSSMMFMAQAISGIFSLTFSLYARSLGASLTLVGALGSTEGITRIFASVPVGMISDLRGSKKILAVGIFLFAISSALSGLVPSSSFLFPIRILTGLATASTFLIGIAYLGSIVAKDKAGPAIGLYNTGMGLGFMIGPIIGGLVVSSYGYRIGFEAAAIMGIVGFFIACRGLSSPSSSDAIFHHAITPPLTKLRTVIKNPYLLAASWAHLVASMEYTGAIVSFFPLYASSLSISEAAIGSMFAMRALMSTLARVPTGFMFVRLSARSFILISLAIAMLVLFLISWTTQPILLSVLLVVEGIASGMFTTSAHTFFTEHTVDSERGTAIGVYSAAGSIGSALGPFLLGLIADQWGLYAIFRGLAIFMIPGIGLLIYLNSRSQEHQSCSGRFDREPPYSHIDPR